MADEDWRDWFRNRSRPGNFAHPDSPAGGTGTGFSRPPGTLRYTWPWSRLPHPDSPAAGRFDWQLELCRIGRQEREGLAQQIAKVENSLAQQSDSLRDALPDVSLRTLYEEQVGQIRGTCSLEESVDGTTPDFPGLLSRLQIALDWASPRSRRTLHERPGFEALIGNAFARWEYGTLREKRQLLKDIEAHAEPAYEAARKNVQEQVVSAERTGNQAQLVEIWKTRDFQPIVFERFSEATALVETGALSQRRQETPPKNPEKPKLHWIEVELLPRPDAAARKKWWSPYPAVTYPNEPFAAEVTDGHKDSRLNSDGWCRYDRIPGGTCSWKFIEFFDETEKALKPAPAVKDAKSISGPTHKKPKSYKVDLIVQKPTLTLKHDNQSNLEIKVIPADAVVDEYRIEIRRASAAAWSVIGNAQELAPWTGKIAGKFKLRGVAKIEGKEVVSAEKDMEVQFPTYSQIVGDADVQTAVGTAWTNTLADCTSNPNQRREHGFWINLNTTTGTYEFGPTVHGAYSGPAAGAAVNLPPRPPDVPAAPTPSDAGATYPVASFHTHTPTVFRPGGGTRGVGPSPADGNADNTDDVPGVVYDYVESPAGSGSIPMGHPKNSATQLYHSQGRTRRTTPP